MTTHSTPETAELAQKFQQRFGSRPSLFRAPGRVNLIGEHTDYNDGFVMPAAIDFYTWVAASRTSDRTLHIWSEQFQELVDIPLDQTAGIPRGHWSDYVRGMAAVLQIAGVRLEGANLMVQGNVPVGAGLSSSASLELSTGLALLAVAAAELPRVELVKLAQRAENEYAGAMCGIMDQFIVGFGHAKQALLLDCRSLQYDLLPIASHVKLVICNSMVKHDLAAGEYNARRAECAKAVEILAPKRPEIRALRDVSHEFLESEKQMLPGITYRRARHVVSENERTLKAADCLRENSLRDFGALMYASHESLRDDYEVSCTELDLLVSLASRVDGVLGARMTGGGFGGCTINLVEADAVADFQQQIQHGYQQQTGRLPDVFVCTPAEGAQALQIEETD